MTRAQEALVARVAHGTMAVLFAVMFLVLPFFTAKVEGRSLTETLAGVVGVPLVAALFGWLAGPRPRRRS